MSADEQEPTLEEQAPKEDDSSSIFDGALPAWMVENGGEPTSEQETPKVDQDQEIAEPGASIPDWLAASEEQPESDDQPEKPVEVGESQLPEWFSSSDEEEPATPAQEPDEEIPDWLTATAESTEDPAPAGEPVDGDLPDWIEDSGKDLAVTPIAEPPSEPSTPESTQDPDTDLPDWLVDSSEEAQSQPAEESAEGEIPEWLLTSDDVEPSAFPEAQAKPVDDGIPDWMSGEEDEEQPQISTIPADPDPETPDWLSGLEEEGLGWPEAGEGESPAEELELDWVDKIGEDVIPGDADLTPASEDLFKIDELTELLSEVDKDSQFSDLDGEVDGLAPAELPGWLEAMRPVDKAEDSDSTLDRGAVEQTGPLAGLSGVLMAEPEIARLKKAPKLSSRLEVSEAQSNHVKVFKDLLETEGQAQELPKPSFTSSHGLLRWLSAFFLILVIGLVVTGESQIVSAPPLESVPAEVLNTSKLVNTIEPQDPVLVSFDFEPGTSGEMGAAAAAVVDHLMIRGAYLTLVSTSPTGPALAEHFITAVQSEHQYSSGSQYINLGFIPGGASGLLGFVQMPQRITPLSFDGMAAWETRPLQGVYSLADFKIIFVITDDPDTARSWIEQVEPRIGNTPLVMTVSAQVEPILKPYSAGENPQVRGMVAGVTGGAAYEIATGKPNLARTYWDALNFGLMTAIAAILIGGIANIFTILFRSRNQGEA